MQECGQSISQERGNLSSIIQYRFRDPEEGSIFSREIVSESINRICVTQTHLLRRKNLSWHFFCRWMIRWSGLPHISRIYVDHSVVIERAISCLATSALRFSFSWAVRCVASCLQIDFTDALTQKRDYESVSLIRNLYDSASDKKAVCYGRF